MERWARKPVNHTSLVAVVTRTDRPSFDLGLNEKQLLGITVLNLNVLKRTQTLALPDND